MTAFDSVARQTTIALPTGADLERLRGGLRIIALRALGDPDAAEEAVQETLARAVSALAAGRVTDPSKLTAYVAGIVRHVCSHIHRDRKDTVPVETAETGALASGEDRPSSHPDALEALVSAEDTARLRAAFDTLSSEDQELLRLSFHEDRSPAEIAESLREPADRIRKRKSRALDRLRQAFLERGGGHDDTPNGTIQATTSDPRGARRRDGND